MSDHKLTLYDLSQLLAEVCEITDRAIDEGRELSVEELEFCQQATLAMVRKADRYCEFMQHLDAQSELAAKAIKILQDRKKGFDGKYGRLEQFALNSLLSAGLTEAEGDTHTIKIKKLPPTVRVIADQIIPNEYRRITQNIALDLIGIKAALKAGKEVPGVVLETERRGVSFK